MKLLLIDDDRRLAEMVASYLAQSGFTIEHCPDAASGLAALARAAGNGDGVAGPGVPPPPTERPGLVLLDLMLPDGDGLDVCRRIREYPAPVGQVPVLMLTARGETTDRVVGLELGADDYLPKPFEPRELLARVRALLRRAAVREQAAVPGGAGASGVAGASGASGASPAPAVSGPAGAGPAQRPAGADADVLVFGRLEIDADARRVRVDGQERPVTAYQFDLLLALARHAGRVMSRERLMDLVKGEALEAFDRSIDVHVGKIRQAIEDDSRNPRRLLTVRGAGYVFARQQD